jgi:hypothetical protein
VGFTGPFFFARCGSPIPAIPDKEPMFKFLLGLPHVMRGPLIDAARSLNAPVLINAHALSIWKKDARDIPVWHGFRTSNLNQFNSLEAYLDSARFVAASRYRGFAWTIDQYLDLGAAYPWHWFASMDYLSVHTTVNRQRLDKTEQEN